MLIQRLSKPQTAQTVFVALLVIGLCMMLKLRLVEANALIQFSDQEKSSIGGHGPWPVPIPNDPGNGLSGQAWAEELGASLFFDASLSHQNSFSCGSCHDPEKGFGDDLKVAVGAELGQRNTQGLFDVGLQRWFGWDGGADSLWAASLRPMLAAHEMNNSIENIANALRANERFVNAILINVNSDDKSLSFLSDTQVAVLGAKSIAAFVRTLQSEPTPFDLYREALINNDTAAQQAYPDSAKRGLKIFLGEANCRVCHFGPNFSNSEFHDTGRPFFTGVGQVDPGRYTGIKRVKADPFNLLGEFADRPSQVEQAKTANVKIAQSNWGQWRTPSLRNLKSTAPYMHDGSLATLRDVVDAYADIDPARLHAAGEAFLKPLLLDSSQRDDLVQFLLSLSPVE